MGKIKLNNLVALEYSKISSSINLISLNKAVKNYAQEPHNLSIDIENQTWSYGTNKPRSLWVPGHFTAKIGQGKKNYDEGIIGIYDKTRLIHLNNMIFDFSEL